MKNKKRNLIIFSTLLVIVVGVYLLIPKTKEEESNRTKPNVNTNGFLTLMLEQDDGTYKKTTSNTWPGDGYAFNNELSGCERGGELVYDRETNIVKLISSGSDKCYVYFDKYNVAKITNVTNTKTTNSVTLTVTTEAGENPIDKYYFSKDDGNSYQESASQTYTFNELTPNTTYTFKVYAKDTLGYETNEETVQVTTNAYVNPVVNSITVTDTTTNSISIRVSASGGTNSVATYYYSINNGAYSSSSSNTKTFTGLNKGTTYTIKVYVKDTNGVSSSEKTTSAETEEVVYYLSNVCGNRTNLATCIKKYYNNYGTSGTSLYYHTSSLANSAADNSYRYSGANPNNYVCFGSTASTCPSDNLYRIIGVFGSEVKLIKADYTTTTMTGSGGDYYGTYFFSTPYYKGSMNTSNIASYYWNYSNGTSSTNTWSESRLNKTNLNSSYLSYIGTTWSNKIATHTWYVGGYSTNGATPKTFYNAESSGTTYKAKIGLMYVSDYGYAASNSYWTTNMTSYSSTNSNNWMYMGLYEWTISRNSSISYSAFQVYDSGMFLDGNVRGSILAVRPVFYLRSSTTYLSGSGTSSDPIRIN